MIRPTIFSLLIAVLLTSCVSKKKHVQMIETMQAGQNRSLARFDSLSLVLKNNRIVNEQLRLDLAERKGENNMLLLMQDKYEAQIKTLEDGIAQLSDKSQSNQQDLNEKLREKNQEIKKLNDILIAIDKFLEGNEQSLGRLADELRFELQNYGEKNYKIESQRDAVKVILSEDFVFKKSSTTRLETKATEALERLATVIQRYPNMAVTIIGHTDNSSPPSGYKSNWIYSVLKAAALAEIMTEDFGSNSSQMTAAGRGAFQPRASNETAEGRSENRRIELLLQPRDEDLARAIRKKFN